MQSVARSSLPHLSISIGRVSPSGQSGTAPGLATSTTKKKRKGKTMENSKPTQNERGLDYIDQFGSITQLEALRDLGVMRLASRISDLRGQGYPIVSETVSVENRFGEKCNIKRYRFKEADDEQRED